MQNALSFATILKLWRIEGKSTQFFRYIMVLVTVFNNFISS